MSGYTYQGYDLTKEEEAKAYVHNIGIEFRFRCYKENDAEVCHLLGLFLDNSQNDPEQAKKVFKVNCDNNKWGQSCYRYAYALDREKKPENVDKVIEYAHHGCENGVGKSCYLSSVRMGEKAEQNPDLPDRESVFRKSLELMDKACSLEVGRACFNLSSLHYMGLPEINMKKNLKKVLEYSIKGCESKHLQSCVNTTLMYMKGEGTEKNEKLAKQFEEKARELHRSMVNQGITMEESL